MDIQKVRAAERTMLEKKLQSATSPWDRLPILIELTKAPSRNDPSYNHQCAQEALSLARGLNDPFWIACSLRALGIFMLRTSRYSDVLDYLNEASRIFVQLNDVHMKAQTDVPIANTYLYQGKFEEAIKLLVPSLNVLEATGTPHWIGITNRSLGDAYKGIGELGKAIEYYRKAVAIARRSNLQSELGAFYQQLAHAYRTIEDHAAEKKYLFKSFAIFRRTGDLAGIGGALANIATMYLGHQQYERAERYIRRSIKAMRDIRYTVYEALSWGQMGTVYAHRKEYSKAFRCFRKGIRMVRGSENPLIVGTLYEKFGQLLIETGRYDRGAVYLKKAIPMISDFGQPFYQYRMHLEIAQALEKAGDLSKALKHYKAYDRIKQEYANHRKYLEASLAETNGRIQDLVERLKEEQFTKDSLTQSIEQKEAELVSLTLGLIRNEEQIRKKGRTINCATDEGDLPPSNNWDIFARQFHKIHHDFYPTLLRQYSNLSPVEMKVCSLIRIGLSSKEIAGILCVAKRTVDNHRTRIHRKMALPQGSSLSGFIMKI